MPIYEYVCKSCHHEFEALQKLSDDPLRDCPKCNQSALQKKISAAGFRLAGSGWYETDFKSGNKKNLAGDDKAPSAGSSETKSTSTPKADSGKKPDSASTSKAS